MRLDRTGLVKLVLFACLILTAYKGLMRLPEVASVSNPQGFFRGLTNDGENSLIMKERHFDYNHETLAALELRYAESLRPENAQSEDSLTTTARIQRAIRKAQAKDVRNADYVDLAREALERAKRLRDQDWRMGWTTACEPWPAGAVRP